MFATSKNEIQDMLIIANEVTKMFGQQNINRKIKYDGVQTKGAPYLSCRLAVLKALDNYGINSRDWGSTVHIVQFKQIWR